MGDPLAAAARRELESREKYWPAEVREGRMPSAEADADIAAWRGIAELIEHGEASTDCSWHDLRAAADRAVELRMSAVEQMLGTDKQRGREQRLGNVIAIQRLIKAQMLPRALLSVPQPGRIAA